MSVYIALQNLMYRRVESGKKAKQKTQIAYEGKMVLNILK